MLTGMYPSPCEGYLVRGTIPRREQAVLGMPVRRCKYNDRSGSKARITAPQRQWQVHLSQRTYQSKSVVELEPHSQLFSELALRKPPDRRFGCYAALGAVERAYRFLRRHAFPMDDAKIVVFARLT